MAKLYVPDGAWLVCSDGMKKQQIKVTSQSKINIAGAHLQATVDDRPGGNFICGKMAIAGAIIGAVAGLALVAGSIITGGALAVAACAAVGAAAGVGVSLIPSICGMLLKDWTPFDSNVLITKKHPIMENSQIPCRLGGNVMILYSEKAADEFTDITLARTGVNVLGVIALSYILYPALSAIGTTAVTAKTTIATFGWGAGANYLGGVTLAGVTAYGVGWSLDQGKGVIYSSVPTGEGTTLKNYIDGFESEPEKIVQNHAAVGSDGDKALYEHTNDVGGATGVGKDTVGNRTSEYTVTERSTSVRLDDIEEHGVTTRTESGRVQGAVEGRNPVVQQGTNVTNQDFGGRYQEIEQTTTTTNSQYRSNTFDYNSVKETVGTSFKNGLSDNFGKPTFSTKDGVSKGGFYIGLLQDAYKGITNFILKGQAEDLMNALKNEEAEARAKINVLAGKD
ncbi:PAAR-like protein [Chryseobacterium sp.]|uniref:PAAR-like protein n=1 Tax=Chryseobacterium sp. TaxID=1871047 RepID=UPI0025B9B519|nr:PAAR-like protein [Chryseobacterium sp.]